MGLTDRETFKGVPAKHVYFILLRQHFFFLCVLCSVGKRLETTPLRDISREIKVKTKHSQERGWEKNKTTNYKSCQPHLWCIKDKNNNIQST